MVLIEVSLTQTELHDDLIWPKLPGKLQILNRKGLVALILINASCIVGPDEFLRS